MKKSKIYWKIWKINHDVKKQFRQVVKLIPVLVFLGILFICYVGFLKETSMMTQKDNENRELLIENANLQCQIDLCNGKIPDGPEYHRGIYY